MKTGRRELLVWAVGAALVGCRKHAPSSIPLRERNDTMNTRPLMTLRLTTAPVVTLGGTPQGQRTIWPVTGGTFEGDRLRGKVLPGGADWVTTRSDGVVE